MYAIYVLFPHPWITVLLFQGPSYYQFYLDLRDIDFFYSDPFVYFFVTKEIKTKEFALDKTVRTVLSFEEGSSR